MRKAFAIALLATAFAVPSFATYMVVLKNGTQYKAKAKWTVNNGKAYVKLESGQTLQIDPAEIDVAKSEQATRLGLGDARLIDLNPEGTAPAASKPQQSLGSSIKLRPLGGTAGTPAEQARPQVPVPPPAGGSGSIQQEVLDKFDRAFDNVGIFEKRLTSTGQHSLRAEVTADSEEKVFNAISATSFLMTRNAGVAGAKIEMVELFMKTTTGGSSGRFQMTRADAEALDKKQITQQDYFVRKVLY